MSPTHVINIGQRESCHKGYDRVIGHRTRKALARPQKYPNRSYLGSVTEQSWYQVSRLSAYLLYLLNTRDKIQATTQTLRSRITKTTRVTWLTLPPDVLDPGRDQEESGTLVISVTLTSVVMTSTSPALWDTLGGRYRSYTIKYTMYRIQGWCGTRVRDLGWYTCTVRPGLRLQLHNTLLTIQQSLDGGARIDYVNSGRST